MKSEQIKEITEKATEQLVAALQPRPQRGAYQLSQGHWTLSPLQSAQRPSHRIAEAECQLRRGLSHVERTRPLRQERRERHHDSRPDHST
jgi:hypothetical protein